MNNHGFIADKFTGRGRVSLVYIVHRSDEKDQGKRYALKRYFLQDSLSIKLLLVERKCLEKVSNQSPFLPTLEAAFRKKDSAFLVMTAGCGINMVELLYIRGRLSEEDAVFYAAEILCGLEHLHQLKIVHLDIKPDNILITNTGHIMIIDFDNSIDISFGKSKHPFAVAGTSAYRSPEVANDQEIDEKADVWGWASVLVALLGGKARDLREDRSILLEQSKRGEILSETFQHFSRNARRLVMACFRFDPKQRLSLEEIKRNAFFKKIDWIQAASCKLTPPIQISDFQYKKAKEARKFDENDPVILANFYNESEVINARNFTENSDGTKTYLHFVQDFSELANKGFTSTKIDEIFTGFDFDKRFFE